MPFAAGPVFHVPYSTNRRPTCRGRNLHLQSAVQPALRLRGVFELTAPVCNLLRCRLWRRRDLPLVAVPSASFHTWQNAIHRLRVLPWTFGMLLQPIFHASGASMSDCLPIRSHLQPV